MFSVRKPAAERMLCFGLHNCPLIRDLTGHSLFSGRIQDGSFSVPGPIGLRRAFIYRDFRAFWEFLKRPFRPVCSLSFRIEFISAHPKLISGYGPDGKTELRCGRLHVSVTVACQGRFTVFNDMQAY